MTSVLKMMRNIFIKKNYLIPSSFGVKKKLNGERLLKGIKKLSVKNLSNLQK